LVQSKKIKPILSGGYTLISFNKKISVRKSVILDSIPLYFIDDIHGSISLDF